MTCYIAWKLIYLSFNVQMYEQYLILKRIKLSATYKSYRPCFLWHNFTQSRIHLETLEFHEFTDACVRAFIVAHMVVIKPMLHKNIRYRKKTMASQIPISYFPAHHYFECKKNVAFWKKFPAKNQNFYHISL